MNIVVGLLIMLGVVVAFAAIIATVVYLPQLIAGGIYEAGSRQATRRRDERLRIERLRQELTAARREGEVVKSQLQTGYEAAADAIRREASS